MRDPARINHIIEDLKAAWEQHPDMRLAQLVSCAARIESEDVDVFFAEDDHIRKGLQRLQRKS